MIILFLFCIGKSAAAEAAAPEERESVYVDPASSAGNLGTEPDPYQDIEDAISKAEELAAQGNPVTIWIMGEVLIDSDTTWDFADQDIEFKRYENYKGILFRISSSQITFTLENTVVDGNSESVTADAPMLYANGTLYADNVIFQNNTNVNEDSTMYGGALYAAGGANNFELKRCIIRNNTAYNGGAVYIHTTTIKINTTEVSGNRATNNGGAIATYSSTASIAVVENSTITNNTAKNGGAVYLATNSSLTTTDTDLSFNEAASQGGFLYSVTCRQVNISGGNINHNKAAGNGGVFFITGSNSLTDKIYLSNININNNHSEASGGVLYATNSPPAIEITGGTISGNTAARNGGAIYITSSEHLRLKQIAFDQNTAVTGWHWELQYNQGEDAAIAHETYVTDCTYSIGPEGTRFTNAYSNYDVYCNDLGDLSDLKDYHLTLTWYYEDEQHTWCRYESQPGITEYDITGKTDFTIPHVTLTDSYKEYYYTSSADDHQQEFPFTDKNITFRIDQDTEINIYCICTQIDITLPPDNFLWYATASSAITESNGTLIGYEIASAKYEITNNSPSKYMKLDVSIENFTTDAAGSNDLAPYEPDIELNFHLADEDKDEIDAGSPVGKDMFGTQDTYMDTYSKPMESDTTWTCYFSGIYVPSDETSQLPPGGLMSDYILTLNFEWKG